MKYEYLLFNLVILLGPLVLSFDSKVRYVSKWRYAFAAIFIVLIPFVIWDSLVTESHWWFNSKYTSDIKLFELPLSEWLFFVSVPFACLFIWQIIVTHKGKKVSPFLRSLYFLSLIFVPLGIYLFVTGKQYSGLVLIVLAITLFYDHILKTDILVQTRAIMYMGIITALMFIFNGYLTARPVVLYGEQYQLGFRIFTIPIEDFAYGYTLVLLNTILYEKFKGLANA